MADQQPFTELEKRRLLAAVYPTRTERLLAWLAGVVPAARLAEWLDRMVIRSWHRRAAQGRDLIAAPRKETLGG